MKKYAFWLLLLIPIYAAIVVRCTPSLHPIYKAENIIFDPALIGVWGTEDSEDRWTIAQAADVENAYMSTWSNADGETGHFLTYLVAVGDHKFLDMYPSPQPDEYDYSMDLMVGSHLFAVVDQIEPDLMVRSMDDDWLAFYLRDNPHSLKHEWVESGPGAEPKLVLTASVEELQAFMVEHLDTEGAYSEADALHRMPDAAESNEEQDSSGEK